MNTQSYLIDTHCHLNFDDYKDTSVPNLIARAKENNVQKMIAVGTGAKTNQEVVALAVAYPELYAAVGLHPTDVGTGALEELGGVKKLTGECQKIVAIGEIGLDYYHSSGEKLLQQEVFMQALELASKLHLPVIVHDREAHDDVYRIIYEAKKRYPDLRGVMHCFSGDSAYAQKMFDLGFLISFTGIVTFPKATAVHEAVTHAPLEKMMLETDAPFLSPVPFRGKRNEPAYVHYIAQKIAELKQVSVETVASITTANAQKLFGI